MSMLYVVEGHGVFVRGVAISNDNCFEYKVAVVDDD